MLHNKLSYSMEDLLLLVKKVDRDEMQGNLTEC